MTIAEAEAANLIVRYLLCEEGPHTDVTAGRLREACLVLSRSATPVLEREKVRRAVLRMPKGTARQVREDVKPLRRDGLLTWAKAYAEVGGGHVLSEVRNELADADQRMQVRTPEYVERRWCLLDPEFDADAKAHWPNGHAPTEPESDNSNAGGAQ